MLEINIIRLNTPIHIFLMCALAFFIPIFPLILSPIILLIVFNWLLAPKQIIVGFKANINNPGLILLVLFYAIYLIGMCYSTNLKFGREELETKLSFIVFPFVLSTYSQSCKDFIDKYLKFFVFGCLFYATICFLVALYRYVKPEYIIINGLETNLGIGCFYYTNLSIFLHPSYSAMYSVFALAILFYFVSTNKLQLNWKWCTAIILLVLFVLMLSSKAGWISLSVISCYLFTNLFKQKKYMLLILISVFLGSMFYILNIKITPVSITRIPKIAVITGAIKNQGILSDSTKDVADTDGSGSRVLVWKAAVDIVKSNFIFGVGTGDAKDVMLEKYIEKGMVSEYKTNLNSHNQYFNTFIPLGIFGFAILVFILAAPFYFYYKRQQLLFKMFVLIAALNFLVESMLEVQAGVIYFVFIYVLLSFSFEKKSKNISTQELTIN